MVNKSTKGRFHVTGVTPFCKFWTLSRCHRSAKHHTSLKYVYLSRKDLHLSEKHNFQLAIIFVKRVEGSKKTSQGLLAENHESKKWFSNLISCSHISHRVLRILYLKAEMFEFFESIIFNIANHQILIQFSLEVVTGVTSQGLHFGFWPKNIEILLWSKKKIAVNFV